MTGPGRRITEADSVVVDVFDLAGPRIRRLSTWFDTAAVLRQVRGG